MICDYFRVTGAHDTVLDYADLFSVTLRDANVQEFGTRRGRSSILDDKKSIRWCLRKSAHAQFKTVFELYDMKNQSSEHVDAQMSIIANNGGVQTRNYDCETLTADTRKLKQEQWSIIEKGMSGVEQEKVCVNNGKKKASVRKETVAVSGTIPNIMHKNQTSTSRGRSGSRKRSIRGKGNQGSSLRKLCSFLFDRYLHANVLWILALARVPTRSKNETGCKAGEKCLFPHYKIDWQPNKKSKWSYFSNRRESDDKTVVAIVKSVPQLGCVSQGSDAPVSHTGKQPQETRCKRSWDLLEEYDSLSLVLRQASISEKKGPSLGKVNVKDHRQRSLYAEIWGQVPRRDW